MNFQNIFEQLKIDEGFISISQWDEKQYTYGYGCTAPGPGAIISRDAAEKLLVKRVNQAIKEYCEIFGDQPINDVRQNALVNMVFNMGKGGLLKFKKMLAAIKQDDWEEAANQAKDSLWYQQLKNSGDPPGRARRIVGELRRGQKSLDRGKT